MSADSSSSSPALRGAVGRIAAFAALFVALQWAYGRAGGSALERLVIEDLTVRPAVMLLGMGWPELAVRGMGSRIVSPSASINVLNGCEGTDIAFLLIAGMVVAPLAWRWRLAGLLAGLPLVFVLNQLRVLALFHALRVDPAWFERLHGVVAPLVLVLAVGLFFFFWLERFAPAVGAARQPAA